MAKSVRGADPTPIARAHLALTIVLFAAMNSLACQSHDTSGEKGINVWHIVLVHMKNPQDEVAGDKIIAASKSLETVPGVLAVHAGRIASGDRLNQGHDYEIGIVMGFRSFQAINAYVSHPAHKKIVEEVLKPLVSGYTSYDFANH